MKISQKKLLSPFLFTLFFCFVLGQPSVVFADAMGVEALVLTTHVSYETVGLGEHYPRKLDKKGRFVGTPGVEINYDWTWTNAPWHIKAFRVSGAEYYDSLDRKAGYLHMGPRWEIAWKKNLQISLGIGPTLIFRESWNNISEVPYHDGGEYTDSKTFLPGLQHKFIPGGDVDLQYRFAPHWQAVWSIVPGIPFIITQSFGVRWSF